LSQHTHTHTHTHTAALTHSSKQKQEQQQGGSNRSSNNLANPYSSHRALEAYSKVTYGQIVEEIKSLQNEYPGFLDVRREEGEREGERAG